MDDLRDAGTPYSNAIPVRINRNGSSYAVYIFLEHPDGTFLKRHGLLEHPARFDVIAVTWPPARRRPTIEHFQNAFEAVGKWEFYS